MADGEPQDLPAGAPVDDSSGETVKRPSGGAPVAASGASPELDHRLASPPQRYRVLRELARGGMGRVLVALDQQLDREVAVKELLLDDPDARARFVREARLTARLQHPSIVSIHEAGALPGGEPYFVMRQILGRPLDQLFGERATLAERLELLPNVTAAVEAMAYAHEQGIVHRDLKPANILVGRFGETVVIDWGLAKLLTEPQAAPPAPGGAPRPAPGGSATQSAGDLTVAGSVMGTPAFMPPEQARGEPVDARADVYALGAILHHLLSGRPPYRGPNASAVLEDVLRGPFPPLTELETGAAPDLLAIVARATAYRAEGRYQSAAELASELRRYQAGQPIAARRSTGGEQLRRWAGRNRPALGMLGLAGLGLCALAGVAVRSVLAERDRAWSERDEARLEVARAGARADAQALATAEALREREPGRALEVLRSLSFEDAQAPRVRMLAADLLSRLRLARVLPGYRAPAPGAGPALAFSPDGALLALASASGGLALADVATGEVAPLPEAGPVRAAAFSPDGAWLAWGAASGEVRLRPLAGGAVRTLAGHAQPVAELRFSPDARTLASSDAGGQVRLWEVASGAGKALPAEARGRRLAFSHDGKRLALSDPGLVVWDLAEGKAWEAPPEIGAPRDAAFGPPWAQLAVLDRAGGALLCEPGPAGCQALPPGEAPGRALALTANGRTLVVADAQDRLALYDLNHPQDGPRRLPGRGAQDRALALSPEGELAAVASGDGEVRLWDLASGDLQRLGRHGGAVREVAFSADGRQLASAGEDGEVRLWDLSAHWRALLPNAGEVLALGVDRRAQRLVAYADSLQAGRTIWTQEADGGESLQHLPGGPLPRAEAGRWVLSLSADGSTLAEVDTDLQLRVRALPGGGVAELGEAPEATGLALSDDGVLLAELDPGRVRVWDAVAHKLSREVPVAAPRRVAFGPDRLRLAVADAQGRLFTFDLVSGKQRELTPGCAVQALAFQPDGRALALGCPGPGVALLDLASGQVRPLRGEGAVQALAFSPDGKSLATWGEGRGAALWDLESGEHRLLPAGAARPPLAFAPDKHTLLTAWGASGLRLWPDDLPRQPELLRAALRGAR